MARAVAGHNAYDELGKITCPTLIIGGKQDKIVTAEASSEMAEQIPHNRLYLYEDFGHGTYEEAKDFNQRILNFLS